MDFKDFCNQKMDSQEQKITKTKLSQLSEEQLKNSAQEMLNKYSNYSQDQLMQELINQTKQKQKDGSLSPEKMEQMYQTIYNILPQESRKNLQNIFDRLK